jgi:FAD/FMN-containing dehydrogenase
VISPQDITKDIIMTNQLLSPDVRAKALTGLCGGAVHLAGDAEYDAVRMAWNAAVDQRPAAVAIPRDAADVSAVVRASAEAGLRVAPQSTGHNAWPLALQGLDEVVLVRMSAMTGVSVDPVARTCRVEGGALWLDAVEAAAEHGLATLHGSSPDVGIAGYSLGGGIGWYARKLGLATNSLTAVEIVIADGTLVRADAENDPELFWAVRGGGGNFGIVTALEFALYPIETAYAGMLIWDREDAEKVLRTWAAWAPGAPDEITTAFRILNLPPLPDIPEFLRGRSIAVIDGAVLGSDESGEELLRELRALQPEIDTFARVPAASLVRLHMDPEGATPVVSNSAMLAGMPDEAVDAFLAQVGPGTTSTLLVAELRQLGGALGRPQAGHGALAQLDGEFVAFACAIAPTPEAAAGGSADAAAFVEALRPFANESAYLNFCENPTDVRSAYDTRVWPQLVAIRSAVDPNGLFAANHAVPPIYQDGKRTY